jgi:MYXO-CTERM domain-containing protein
MATMRAPRPLRSLALVIAVGAVVVTGARPAAANEPPSVPVLDNPSDQSGVTTITPVFAWQPSTDPDGDPVSYDVEVLQDGILFDVVYGVGGTLTQMPTELQNGETYAWRARAVDGHGLASDYSPENVFSVVATCECGPDIIEDEGGGCRTARAPSSGVILLVALVVAVARRRRRR